MDIVFLVMHGMLDKSGLDNEDPYSEQLSIGLVFISLTVFLES